MPERTAALKSILRAALGEAASTGEPRSQSGASHPVIDAARTALLQAAANRDAGAARRAADEAKARLVDALNASTEPDRDAFTLLVALALLTRDPAIVDRWTPLVHDGDRPLPAWASPTAVEAWRLLRRWETVPVEEATPAQTPPHANGRAPAGQEDPIRIAPTGQSSSSTADIRALLDAEPNHPRDETTPASSSVTIARPPTSGHASSLALAFAAFLATTFLTAAMALLPLFVDEGGVGAFASVPGQGWHAAAAGLLLVLCLLTAESLTRLLAEPSAS